MTTLCQTIREKEVAIFIDRFFTSVNLMKNLNYACVGTVMSTRKYLPDMAGKLKRGESMAKCINSGIICYKWQDVKEVLFCIRIFLRTCKFGITHTLDTLPSLFFLLLFNSLTDGYSKSDIFLKPVRSTTVLWLLL